MCLTSIRKNNILQDVLEIFTFCFSHAPRAQGSSSTWQSTPSGPWHGRCGLQAPAWTSISLSCTWHHLGLTSASGLAISVNQTTSLSSKDPHLHPLQWGVSPSEGGALWCDLPHPFSCRAKVFCILQSLFYHNYLIVDSKLSMFKSQCSFCLLILPRPILC